MRERSPRIVAGNQAIGLGHSRPCCPLALAHTRLGHDGAALDTLLTMEALAPDWTRFQTQPRQIVRELRDRAGHPPRLTDLAHRMGVTRV